MTVETVYIGIDPTGGSRPITYAVLDRNLQVRELADADLDTLLSAIQAYPSAVCGIDAPSDRNHRLLMNPKYRASIGLDPDRDNYVGYRVCEYELRRRGIYIYNTPVEEEKISDWMVEGWQLYDRLQAADFVRYPATGARRLFETYPYAIFTVLAGARPYPKMGLEGLLQRQLILYEEGVDLPDPMRVTEEITRHHLRASQINLDNLHSHDELDALASAFTAWAVDHAPQSVVTVGDPTEGQIMLPVSTLADSY